MEEAGRQVLEYGHQPQEKVGCLSRQESQVLRLQHLWKSEPWDRLSKLRSDRNCVAFQSISSLPLAEAKAIQQTRHVSRSVTNEGKSVIILQVYLGTQLAYFLSSQITVPTPTFASAYF